MKPHRAGRARACVIAAVVCATTLTAQSSSRANSIPQQSDPPLGSPSLPTDVHGLTVLTAGDSWSIDLGNAMIEVDGKTGHRNTIVNGGRGACGLMQPFSLPGIAAASSPECRVWPEKWQDLVDRYRPSAVVLHSGLMDQLPQVLTENDTPRGATDPIFRARFDAQLDRAIKILGSRGATVFLLTSPAVPWDFSIANSGPLNDALRTAAAGHPNTRLLDMHGQLCTGPVTCPEQIDGIKVYDETYHPTEPVLVRLGSWILESIYGVQAATR